MARYNSYAIHLGFFTVLNLKKMKFNLGTFNVGWLSSDIKKEQLCRDIESYYLDLVCLQETKMANHFTDSANKNHC